MFRNILKEALPSKFRIEMEKGSESFLPGSPEHTSELL